MMGYVDHAVTKARHRLSKNEVNAIISSVRDVVPPEELDAVFLFGSKAQPHSKGGDVDLWVLCVNESRIHSSWGRKLRIKLQDSIGEQKMDLIFSGPIREVTDESKKAFLETISSSKVKLWEKKKS